MSSSNTNAHWVLPLERQEWDHLRARVPSAFAKVWNAVEIQAQTLKQGPEYVRPGNTRANVFDCPSGVRLLVSREVHGKITALHASGSIFEEGRPCHHNPLRPISLGNGLAD